MTNLIVPTDGKLFKFVAQDTQAPFALVHHPGISVEAKATLLLMRDLVRLGWRLRSQPQASNSFEFVPPEEYSKPEVRQAMTYARSEVIQSNTLWIQNHLKLAQSNLASGRDVVKAEISPIIEVCESQKSRDLFRMFRYSWSSPSSEYVGRRIRLLIRDGSIKGHPVIGIAALGSSIIHIPDRDEEIGWDTKTRTDRIIYMMDAYVLGALPPYNNLLGGKLISYILASNDIREIYKNRYVNTTTLVKKRKASDLVLLVTTSLYGRNSSQYNRLTYGGELLYVPIGETAGYGTLHISNETFLALRELLAAKERHVSHVFGDGANWRMRVIREACELLGLDSETILRHSFKRGLFAVPLAENWKAFLNGKNETPVYRNLPLSELVQYWKDRWLTMRKQNDVIMQKVREFTPSAFKIEQDTAP